MENDKFYDDWKKIGAVHLVISYGSKVESTQKYLGPSTKNGRTKYRFNLIFINQRPEKIQENKYLKVSFGTL